MYPSEWSGEFRIYDAERVKICLELKERKLTWTEKRRKKKKALPLIRLGGQTQMKAAATLIENTVSAKVMQQLEITIMTLSLGGYWPVMPQTTCSFHFLLEIPNCSVFLTPSLANTTQFLVSSFFFKPQKSNQWEADQWKESFSKSPVHKDACFLPPA